jgi:hypothetical protein
VVTQSRAMPPASWALYFPAEAYVPGDRRALLITELLDALSCDAGWRVLRSVVPARATGGGPVPADSPSGSSRGGSRVGAEYILQLDYQVLSHLCDSADLAAALDLQPLEGLACLEAAMHEARQQRATQCPPHV